MDHPKILEKWRDAQVLELEVWRHLEKTPPFTMEDLKKRAKVIYGWLQLFINLEQDSRVLEIGGAGMPVVDYLPNCIKYGTDPLAYYYSKIFPELKNSQTFYFSSIVEQIPLKQESFHAVIALNVIDHCLYPKKTIEEIFRILIPGGILILSVDVYSGIINFMQKLRIGIGIIRDNDTLHPWRFTLPEILKMLRSKFTPLNVYMSVYDPLSMGPKKGWPVKSGLVAKIRSEKRTYYIGKK